MRARDPLRRIVGIMRLFSTSVQRRQPSGAFIGPCMVCTVCGAIGADVNQIGRNVRQLHYSVGIVPKKDHSRAETLTDVLRLGDAARLGFFGFPKLAARFLS